MFCIIGLDVVCEKLLGGRNEWLYVLEIGIFGKINIFCGCWFCGSVI